jgi:hypothetical protein
MRAHYLVNTGRWADSIVTGPIDLSDVGPLIRSVEHFALGLAALRRGDRRSRAAARAVGRHAGLALHRRSVRRERPGAAGAGEGAAGLPRARRRRHHRRHRAGARGGGDAGHDAGGLRPAGRGEARARATGGDPARNREQAEAQREFTLALAQAPRRALSLLGLARSAAAAGDRQIAERARADLQRVWARADADLPGRVELGRISLGEAGE